MSVALIACSNGYGHTRRILSIYMELKKKNIGATIFAKKKILNDLIKIYNLETPIFNDFDSCTQIENLVSGSAIDWENKLPSIKKFKIIISDNLPDILNLRYDAILSGSFFWHMALKNIHPKIKKKHEYLISKYKPTMISSNLFTPNYIEKKTHLYKVGLFKFRNIKIKTQNKQNLLISFGSNNKKINYEKILNIISNDQQINNQFKKILIEPALFKNNMPKNFIKATYDNKMYESLKLALVRPGIGTLTDLLHHKIKIISFYEKNNSEMSFNAKVLRENNLGININNLNNLSKIIKFANSNNKLKNNNTINFDGAKQTVKFILKTLKQL